jgi:hypothetical protein
VGQVRLVGLVSRGPVDGNFGWLKAQKGKKNERRGYEAFNFAPGPDGTYRCYVPPQGIGYPPSHDDEPEGWTVICLAKNPKHKGVHVVGWYEDATLHGTWLDPPESMIRKRAHAAHPAYDWSYCISSKTAYLIPPTYRTVPFSDTSVRQSKYSFLEEPGGIIDPKGSKRRVLMLLTSRLRDLAPIALKNPSERSTPDPELDPVDPLKGFGTAEDRKKAEKAAEQAVIARYEAKGFTHARVTHMPCGHDFVFTKGTTVRHVEVKGTMGPNPQFFLTRNEHEKGFRSDPSWRLAMVTSVLSAEARRIVEYDAKAGRLMAVTRAMFPAGKAVAVTSISQAACNTPAVTAAAS